MSYDLVVFDPSAAPTDPQAFLDWYERQSEESEDESGVESAWLKAFFLEMIGTFPALNGPHADHEANVDNPMTTDYAVGPSSVYMCFRWSKATEARSHVIELARKHAGGFYDIGAADATIWRPVRPGQYGVFYCFYGSNEKVPGELPLSLDLEQVRSELLPKLVSDSDFLGLVDWNGVTLQFMYEADSDSIWMEIPEPERRGSHGTRLSMAELRTRFAHLPAEFAISAFPELRFGSWEAPPPEKPWWKLG